ncbi:uncharacterized protein BDCG_17651 [Blastomyces dermatitidis ER-3]|uniref:Uncharacterized protein n=1 Tax=Ajellomyces dermatitidis (strain ER-3 / ATCC MYA-2586) TaxID=559297 RepID=A0ABX2VZM6_AJEDR|nr:uncharacterized protein BDCG_17651 [Blastomyces dermatitidis ER-3]OAT02586.1 hypothetical protein BDCG_17651 [Blastomyces dermatitidis ER-3]
MSKIVSRSDEEKMIAPCYQLTRLHGQKAADESVKKSESRSLKDSDVTAERFKQKDTDAEAATEDEMKSVAQIEVKVKSAVKDIHEKKDEEKLKLTEVDKQ